MAKIPSGVGLRFPLAFEVAYIACIAFAPAVVGFAA